MSNHVSMKHLAIIMDGNNRWAKERGLPGIAGHRAGAERVWDMLEVCRTHHVEVLTIFAFSSENWRRPKREVDALMSLFYQYLINKTKKMQKEGTRLHVVGNRSRFSSKLLKALDRAEKLTMLGEQHLVIAADYGGRWDISNAAKCLAEQVLSGHCNIDDINEERFHSHTALANFPPLDLLIRTGGELRISNFLLWQIAYAELHFSNLLWPDFDQAALQEAIASFSTRERRYGLTAEQLKAISSQ
ncbi:MAG: undecaprenyl diphosphate synthase [Cellvibrionaceae bacterium]|jgi:undecaprenyl diphosphate synthase